MRKKKYIYILYIYVYIVCGVRGRAKDKKTGNVD